MGFLPFIPTNPHGVQDGTIVGHQHVKARSGTRKSGQVGYAPGGMDMGRTFPSQRIEYTEPWSTPEAWYVQLQRPSDRRKGWVEVDYATYQLPRDTYVNLSQDQPPRAAPSPRTSPPPSTHLTASSTRIRCNIGRLASSRKISFEERELWRWLSRRIKIALESQPGNHQVEIRGYHFRHECPDPSVYWGTIMLAVEFTDGHQHDQGFAANFDITRLGEPQILVRHVNATFSEPRNRGLPRTIRLVISELGI